MSSLTDRHARRSLRGERDSDGGHPRRFNLYENCYKSAIPRALAVGLMEIEHLFRYPPLAVGLKPSARQGEARLRGLWRIIYSKTISPC
jgi:hypothetical protein